METLQQFDYVIIGAGSAGCVLAGRLSEDENRRVLLLEAGRRDTSPWLHIPVGYFKTMHNPAWDWCYETEPEAGLGGRAIPWPRGKTLGGSSAINGLLYVRGHSSDYDTWRQLGNPGWAYDDVLPYFKKSEDQQRGADEYHGRGGPLGVSDSRFHSELSESFISAGEEAGLPRREDFNGAELEGIGYFQATTRSGLRCGTASAYLKPARQRRNLEVVTRAHVRRIVVEDGRACGVEYERGCKRVSATAAAEVILSAGAIGSPQILMLSGIGPGDELRRHGIDVRHDARGVGQNLQDHLQIRMVFKTKRAITLNDAVRNPLRKMLMGIEYALLRRGPLTMAASQVGVFCRSSPDLEVPDIQFHMQPSSADTPGEGLHRVSAFTAAPCQLRPESRGTIALTSPDPHRHPAIHANYLSAHKDQAVAVAGMHWARRIVSSPSLAPLLAGEWRPGSEVQGDEALLEAARRLGHTVYHPVGTCRMGSDADAVVDPELRCNGVQALRVVDASVMPRLTSGNTNAPTIMIAEKGAEMIKQAAQA